MAINIVYLLTTSFYSIFLQCYMWMASEIPLLNFSGLLPFGSSVGDQLGPSGDDSASTPLSLNVPFTFIGKEYHEIIVS